MIGRRTIIAVRAFATRAAIIAARTTIVERDGIAQAAPAPRFSRTPTETPGAARPPEPVEVILADWV